MRSYYEVVIVWSAFLGAISYIRTCIWRVKAPDLSRTRWNWRWMSLLHPPTTPQKKEQPNYNIAIVVPIVVVVVKVEVIVTIIVKAISIVEA